MADVQLKNVYKSFGDTEVIHGVDLEVSDNEFAVFVGPSGCGKSTLLRLIAGLEDLTAGEISIGNERVEHLPPAKRGIAMVFQSYALYPHMNVYQNMSFGLRLAKVSKSEIDRRVREAADILQIEDYLERKPKELSGGQRQRVAIGRAIVREPKVFLFDEPLSNLDAKLRVQMRIELTKLHQRLNATMIYVTHDQVEAMTMADTIVVLNRGRVEQVGPPMELYHRPKTEFVADFIGAPSMNFLAVSSDGGAVRYAGASLPAPSAPEGAVKLGIRPEHIVLASPGAGAFDATVEVKEALGGESYLYTTAPGGERLVVKTDGDDTTRHGDRIGIALPPDRMHLFSADGANLLL